jgi:hypothetical protein
MATSKHHLFLSKVYKRIEEKIRGKRCLLLLSEEEFIRLAIPDARNWSGVNLEYNGECGHVCVNTWKIFGKKKQHLCKECLKKSVSQKMKTKYSCLGQETTMCVIQECQFIAKMEELLASDFDFNKTEEGCSADFIIKPKNILDNKWMKVQVKTTLNPCYGCYSFRTSKDKYTHHLLLCHCISANKYWLIPYNDVSHISRLNIGLKSSIYSQYEKADSDVKNAIAYYYKQMELFAFDECMKPKLHSQQRELLYRQKIRDTFTNLILERPLYNQSFYDFSVNGVKVQEKILYISGKCFCAVLQRSSRRWYMSAEHAYMLGMNSFYWFHVPNSDIFYLIPELHLYIHKHICTAECSDGWVPLLSIDIRDRDAWYQEFRYNYKTVDKQRIADLFTKVS